MQPYLHAGAESGITDYEIGTDYVLVRFRGGRTYRCSHAHAGVHHVDRMKELASAGRGLTTYINQHVRDLYDREG
jgi:hypothetical protein